MAKTITFGYKKDVAWNQHVVSVKIDGKHDEGKTDYTDTKADARINLRASLKWARGKGYKIVLLQSAKKLLAG